MLNHSICVSGGKIGGTGHIPAFLGVSAGITYFDKIMHLQFPDLCLTRIRNFLFCFCILVCQCSVSVSFETCRFLYFAVFNRILLDRKAPIWIANMNLLCNSQAMQCQLPEWLPSVSCACCGPCKCIPCFFLRLKNSFKLHLHTSSCSLNYFSSCKLIRCLWKCLLSVLSVIQQIRLTTAFGEVKAILQWLWPEFSLTGE